nr:GvpL/GvpF family gas vesicle protein [Anaerolineales bacterium]
YTVPHRDLAAVVSASPLADYRGLKRDEAVRYLVPHQRVVEAVMQAFPVLPVKFGTVLPDETWVRRLLTQGEALFRTALERFSGLVQIEVVVLWDLQQVFQEIGQEEHITQLKAQVESRSLEETMIKRVAIGQMVQASLERRRASLREYLINWLKQVSLDLVVNPPMGDSMVANVALLVDEAGQEALDQQLELLDEEFEGQLTFRCVGPLPPYSFATVEVGVPSFETINEARRRLGLGETATSGKIRRAYHRLAGQVHPDHNPDDPEAEARMAELTRAYELLTAYAETVQGGGGAEEQESRGAEECPSEIRFSREAVERTLLIAVRRQEIPA